MLDLLLILITVTISLTDPIIAVGYIVAGLWAGTWWGAAIGAAGWVWFINLTLGPLLDRAEHIQGPFLKHPLQVFFTSVAAALVAVLVLRCKRLWKQAKDAKILRLSV